MVYDGVADVAALWCRRKGKRGDGAVENSTNLQHRGAPPARRV